MCAGIPLYLPNIILQSGHLSHGRDHDEIRDKRQPNDLEPLPRDRPLLEDDHERFVQVAAVEDKVSDHGPLVARLAPRLGDGEGEVGEGGEGAAGAHGEGAGEAGHVEQRSGYGTGDRSRYVKCDLSYGHSPGLQEAF